MVRPSLFPALAAEAGLADVQVRQTLALGLVPLGIALLLLAASRPEHPPAGLWAGAGAVLAGMALLGLLWRRSGRRFRRGYSTAHFLIRYFFIILCPLLLWLVFGRTILDLAGAFPPVLIGLLLLVYPAGRILRARVGPEPLLAPHLEMAHIACQQLEMVLLVFALAGLISGAVMDANRDYPTDPFPLLIVIWLLAFLTLLAGAVMGFSHWVQLYTKTAPPQTLDDEQENAGPPPPGRYGSDRF